MNLAPVEPIFCWLLISIRKSKFEDGEYSVEPFINYKNGFRIRVWRIRLDLRINADEDGLWDYFVKHGIAATTQFNCGRQQLNSKWNHPWIFIAKVDRSCFTLDLGEVFRIYYQTFYIASGITQSVDL